MGAGWGFTPGCRVDPHSPYYVLADDGVTPVQVDFETRSAWVHAHPPTEAPTRVGYAEFEGGYLSTVFIGTDALAGVEGHAPQLWESAIFVEGSDEGAVLTMRWGTHAKAVAAHNATAAALQNAEFVATLMTYRRTCEEAIANVDTRSS